MIKVGLYLENKRINDVDLSNPQRGNPGIGGTEYNFVNLPYNFMKFYPDDIEFVFFVNAPKVLPQQFSVYQVDDCLKAIELCAKEGCDIFMWRPVLGDETFDVLEKLSKVDIKAIAWAHNTPSNSIMDAMASTENLIKFVTVSHEQLDILRDLPIINKAHVIYNGFDLSSVPLNSLGVKDENMVVYVGSLIPAKGFGVLAKAWPRVLERHPSAELYVIGNGKLYNRGAILGEWGVAEESFEANEIRPYLSDDKGKVISSVHFLGTLGEDKNQYFSKACVGIVNPSARTENCPGSAIEFQAAKTPVVSRAENGLLDTVLNSKTGLLGNDMDDLASNIVYFLKNFDKSLEYGERGREYVADKFDFEKISNQWKALFEQVVNGQATNLIEMKENCFYKKKWARDLVRMSKSYIYNNEYYNSDSGLVSADPDLMYVNQVRKYLNFISRKKYEEISDITRNDLMVEVEETQLNKIYELRDELAYKKVLIENFRNELIEKAVIVDELRNELIEKAVIVDELRNELAEKDSVIVGLREELNVTMKDKLKKIMCNVFFRGG